MARSAGWGAARHIVDRGTAAADLALPLPAFHIPTQCRANALDDDRQAADDQIIGESKDAKSRASKPRVSLVILVSRIRRLVRPAVRLDDEFSREANEIREVRSDRRLPAKAVSVDLMVPQRAPKQGFRPVMV